MSLTLDLDEAAAMLRQHPHTVEAWAREGRLPAAKIGRCWVFVTMDLIDWIRSNYKEGPWRSTNEATPVAQARQHPRNNWHK